jgi:putative molybdopterin biosynthesis protein
MDKGKTLSAQDVADILHVSKSTIYNMIRSGEITSYKVGRKVRFAESDVQEYIDRSRSYVSSKYDATGMRAELDINAGMGAVPGFIICGQDLLLDVLSNYLRLYEVHALRAYIGSYDSLVSLYKRKVSVASTHLWDGQNDQYNNAYVKRLLPGVRTQIIHLAHRMQGLYVREGNPKNLTDWADFGRDDITMVNREYGSGSRVLLDENLKLLDIDGSSIRGYGKETQSHLAVASAVAGGTADVAIGTEKVARQVEGIEFIPLKKEQYDIVVRKEDLDTFEMQTMLKIIRSKAFKEEFDHIGGYDTAGMGEVIAEI